MILFDFGNIVDTEFMKSFEIRNELILHEYIIMPNHMHMIVEIDHGDDGNGDDCGGVQTHGRASLSISQMSISPINRIESSTDIPKITRNPPIRQPK
jgi:hypothetical protein